MKTNWEKIILSRYCGEFAPATEADATIKKSSEDIALDLVGMGEISPELISACLVSYGYTIAFEDAKPVWLLKERDDGQLKIESCK